MRELMSGNRAWGTAIPREPAEVGAAAVGWQRTGLLQRLVKLDRQADAHAAEDRSPTEEVAARRAA
jgi:hypothetical protein